jgi:hypothetical protein
LTIGIYSVFIFCFRQRLSPFIIKFQIIPDSKQENCKTINTANATGLRNGFEDYNLI